MQSWPGNGKVAGSAELVVTVVVVTGGVITAAATLVVGVSGCGAHVERRWMNYQDTGKECQSGAAARSGSCERAATPM